MWLRAMRPVLHSQFWAACLAGLLLVACQPAATPLATLMPPSSTLTSATMGVPPSPAPTDTDIPTPTSAATATQSPTARPPIPTADFAPGDVLGIWMRSDAERGDLYLIFRDDGTYSAAHGSTATIMHGGKYTLDGRLFTFIDGWDCSPKPRDTPGEYVLRIVEKGRYLYLARYDDRCPDRPNALANFRWTRVIATPTPVP